MAVSIECRRSRNLEGTSVRGQNEIRRGGLVTFGGSNCRGRLLWRTLREDVTFCVCDCARLKREIGNGEGTVYCRRSGTSASQMGIGGEGGGCLDRHRLSGDSNEFGGPPLLCPDTAGVRTRVA